MVIVYGFKKLGIYVNSDTSVLYLAIFVSKTESEYCNIYSLHFSIALSTLNKNSFAYEKKINKQLTDYRSNFVYCRVNAPLILD